MSQFGKTGEESMEEILASIRSSVDTPESTPTAHKAPPPEAANGTGHAAGLELPPQNGGGRLQDALLSVAPASDVHPAPARGVSAEPKSIPQTPPSPAPARAAPVSSNGVSAHGDTGSAGIDDLSDLFADPTPPTTPSLETTVPPSETAQKISAATFGTAPPSSPAPTSLSSEDAAALVKPASVTSPTPDVPAAPPQPDMKSKSEVIASMAAPTRSSEAAPTPGDVEPKPKREPSFAALKTLAAGPPTEAVKPSDPAAQVNSSASDASSVLLPEMRDLPGTNPVAQMQSMAATTSPSKPSGFVPEMPPRSSAETSASAGPTTEPHEHGAAIETAAATATVTVATNEPVAKTAAAGLAPGAQVEATAGSRSLEDIVVDLLKPQLAQWLEANMPRIVERALRAEQSGASDKDQS